MLKERFAVPITARTTWYRGNTHAQTRESDGDSSPEDVAAWYKNHGYDFLVLSDHNVFTDPAVLSHLVGDDFLLIPGEEVTSNYESAPVHVNGLNLPGLVDPRTGSTMVATIQNNVDAIREVEGVPHINHPNFGWAFGAEELAQVENDRLLEIHSGHPTDHNDGGGGYSSVEEIWDILLTGGKRIYGIAVDDAHHFQGEFSADRANPGRGWVSVRSRSPRSGRDHAAARGGPVLLEQRCPAGGCRGGGGSARGAHRAPRQFPVHHGIHWLGGRELAVSVDNPAVYNLKGREGYVRARVTNSRGEVAWVQPVFVVER